MVKVTVIIPNYNGIQYIKNCLDSLYRQEEGTPEFSVIVVDNASSDGSRELVRDYFPQVDLIRLKKNTGFCHAVNRGIKKAKTPYVILLNNDTAVMPGFVKYLTEAVAGKKSTFSVSAKMLMWDDDSLVDDAGDGLSVLGWAYSRGKGKPAGDYDKSSEVFSACAGAAIYRKDVFAQIGLFDENHFAYLEDVDIGYRARIYGYRNYFEPRAKVRHAGSAVSGSRYNEFKTRLASANSIYLIWKNMPLFQLILNFPFLLAGFTCKIIFFASKKMGMLYLKGLWQGVKKCTKTEGKKHKIPFRIRHTGNYIKIQLRIYADTFRFLYS